MAALIVGILAFTASATAQLQGRGFPDCENGPLKNNTVCNTSAGEYPDSCADLSLTTRHRSIVKSKGVDQCIYVGREAEQYWKHFTRCTSTWPSSIHLVARSAAWSSRVSWSQLLGFGRIPLCYFLPTAHFDGCSIRRRAHQRRCDCHQYRS